jgi:hypothetical protein
MLIEIHFLKVRRVCSQFTAKLQPAPAVQFERFLYMSAGNKHALHTNFLAFFPVFLLYKVAKYLIKIGGTQSKKHDISFYVIQLMTCDDSKVASRKSTARNKLA